jgi:hypothetical protein
LWELFIFGSVGLTWNFLVIRVVPRIHVLFSLVEEINSYAIFISYIVEISLILPILNSGAFISYIVQIIFYKHSLANWLFSHINFLNFQIVVSVLPN